MHSQDIKISVNSRPLKVAVFYSSRAVLGAQSSGGGVYERSIYAIFQKLATENGIRVIHFVPRARGIRIHTPQDEDRPFVEYAPGVFERIFSWIPRSKLSHLLAKFGLLETRRRLKKEGVHLAYFASDGAASLRLCDIPYVLTVWDLGHRALPGFPEVWTHHDWIRREDDYSRAIGRASFVLVESSDTGRKAEQLYGVASDRWAEAGVFPRITEDVPTRREIPNSYFIYPAVKWPHKNHLTILEAFAQMKNEFNGLKMVFTGFDGGHGDKVKAHINRLGLDGDVMDLGFVNRERMLGLLKFAEGLLMPSLLGPLNLPPFEALQLGVPAIASDAHIFHPEVASRVKVIPGTDVSQWADAMREIMKATRDIEPLTIPEDDGMDLHKKILTRLSKEISVFS